MPMQSEIHQSAKPVKQKLIFVGGSRQLLAWLVALGYVLAPSVGAQAVAVANDVNGLMATIPFAADAGTSVFLSVRMNDGSPQWWALDSGASECIVDRSAAKSARLVTRGHRDIHGAGKGTVQLDSIRSPVHLQLAGRALPTCDHFGALDLRSINAGGRTMAGILGFEFFARYVVRIDFGGHVVQLYDPARFRYSGRGEGLALEFVKKQPLVEVRIKTARRPEATRHLIVDTGSEDAVDDSTVRRTPGGSPITVSTTGLGASYEAVIGTLDTVRIGRLLFTNVPGVASDIGIVGNGIWSRFVCIFDYAHKLLIVESR